MNSNSIVLAIHCRPDDFSERWIERCEAEGLSYRRVDCHDTAILRQLEGVDGLLWRWLHHIPEDQLIARQVIAAAERMGILVFPDSLTSWHFDDKIVQKYLLEAVAAPLIPTYVFVDREKAMDWIASAEFPKVFKLRCGAGSCNVQLVKTRQEAIRICRRMFGKGRPYGDSYFGDFRKKVRVTRDFRHFVEKLKRAPGILANSFRSRARLPLQQGYVYFQDFMAGNAEDIRVTVIGNRAFGFQRKNRPGDFRASGSGTLLYDAQRIDPRCVRAAFAVAEKLDAASMAFDFLIDKDGQPKIGEISYTFAAGAIHDCPGHWDRAMNWQEGHVWPQDAIFDDFLAALEKRRIDRNDSDHGLTP